MAIQIVGVSAAMCILCVTIFVTEVISSRNPVKLQQKPTPFISWWFHSAVCYVLSFYGSSSSHLVPVFMLYVALLLENMINWLKVNKQEWEV
jgi:hypothetical protein